MTFWKTSSQNYSSVDKNDSLPSLLRACPSIQNDFKSYFAFADFCWFWFEWKLSENPYEFVQIIGCFGAILYFSDHFRACSSTPLVVRLFENP